MTLALGSALALFLYPHAVTGVLSSSSRHVIRRNAVVLPAYSLALGLIALLGYMALAAGVKDMPAYADGFKQFGANYAVPALFLADVPELVRGRRLCRHRHRRAGARRDHVDRLRQPVHPQHLQGIHQSGLQRRAREPGGQDRLAGREGGRAVLHPRLQQSYAIQLQLLGGIWIIQTLPAVLMGLYTRWLNPWALLAGWASGIAAGTAMAASLDFKGSIYALHLFGVTIPCYAALSSLVLNLGGERGAERCCSTSPRADATRRRDRSGGLCVISRSGR